MPRLASAAAEAYLLSDRNPAGRGNEGSVTESRTGAVGAAPMQSKDEVARALVGCISRIHARGWCDATSGNFSVTLSAEPVRLLITRTGIDKGRVAPGDLLVIGPDGRPQDGATATPSTEAEIHLAIRREGDAGAILHTHSVWGTLLGERYLEERGLSVQGYEMLKGIEGVRGPWEQVAVPVVQNAPDVTTLADRVSRLIGRRPELRAFLIERHGLYTWGRTLDDAYRHVEVFEFLFQVVGRKLMLER